METLVEFASASKIKDFSTTYSQVDDSYIFCHVTKKSGKLAELLGNGPLKIKGTFLLMMTEGTPITIGINQDKYEISPRTFAVGLPGNVITVPSSIPDDVELYVMFFDLRFTQNINLNLASVAIPSMLERPSATQQLSEEETRIICRYFEMLHEISLDSTNTQLNKMIAMSIIAAMFYHLVQFYHKRMTGVLDESANSQPSGRRHDYVREFVRLVHLHYVRERSVSFYASKLFISPKYLSLLVKEATGRSAAKWIDDFVLMEAKNMLRFSGKNIQQVAYALNFPTQSSFGKYFKHLTGMSPTEYQKS